MKYLYQNKYWKINKEYNIDKLLYLMIDRPDYINDHYGDFIWTNSKQKLHRKYDLPSDVLVIKTSVDLYWRKNNNWHRENNRPAIIHSNGYKEYYINDKFIKDENFKLK